MTYARVIPRDLFNEGNLLTCLGRLTIELGERAGHSAEVCQNEDSGPFLIEQDSADGSIYTEAVELMIHGACRNRLFRPLNARSPWPLFVRLDDQEIEVLDERGQLTPEFWEVIQ